METEDKPSGGKAAPVLPPPPAADAGNKELADYITQCRETLREHGKNATYRLNNFIRERETPSPEEFFNDDAMTRLFVTQMDILNNAFRYEFVGRDAPDIQNALQLQRAFCDTLRLANTIKRKDIYALSYFDNQYPPQMTPDVRFHNTPHSPYRNPTNRDFPNLDLMNPIDVPIAAPIPPRLQADDGRTDI